MNTQRQHITRRDKALIAAVVRFCGARDTSTRQIEARFARAAGLRPAWSGGTFQTIPPSHLYAYIGGTPPAGQPAHPHAGGDRGEARALISAALGFERLSPDECSALVAKLTRQVQATMHVMPTVSAKGRRIEFDLRPTWDGVQAIVYYVALLILSVPQYRRRVGRCLYDECGAYFYDSRLRGGKQRLFCRESHRVAHFRKNHPDGGRHP